MSSFRWLHLTFLALPVLCLVFWGLTLRRREMVLEKAAQSQSNGRQVIDLIQSNPSDGAAVNALIGAPVTFRGIAAPRGRNADLIVGKDIIVAVQISPPQDVRPQAVWWEATVTGTVKAIDMRRKIIYMTASPESWEAIQTG